MDEKEKYAKAAADLELAKHALEEAKKKLALAESPVKVGDVIEVSNYSHQGKMMKVEQVSVKATWVWASRNCHVVELIASGPVLKKDGTPGKQRTNSRVSELSIPKHKDP